MPDRYMEILTVSPVVPCNAKYANKAKTYIKGTTLTYRVGNITPEVLTWLRAKVSGMLSFLRPACRISVICSVVAPTSTFSSFILHGWAARFMRMSATFLYHALTLRKLKFINEKFTAV